MSDNVAAVHCMHLSLLLLLLLLAAAELVASPRRIADCRALKAWLQRCVEPFKLTIIADFLLPTHFPGLTDAVVFTAFVAFAAPCNVSATMPFTSALVACWLQLPVKLSANDSSAI
jgi:hypothetical protein